MANHHFGKFADVWKHLALSTVLDAVRPQRYAETHAGSAAYPLVTSAELEYGVLGYLAAPKTPSLSASPFTRVVAQFAGADPALYPGSALQAMTALGNEAAYLLCDLDPVSIRDLREWAQRSGLRDCEIVERDGMAAVREWLPGGGLTVVHIDPFDPFARSKEAPSAVELAAEVAGAGHVLVYWYGYSAPSRRTWAVDEIGSKTTAPLWWGDFMVTEADGALRDDGDLGRATTAGTGSGVVLANVSPEVLATCSVLAVDLVEMYEGRPLPDTTAGRLSLEVGHTE